MAFRTSFHLRLSWRVERWNARYRVLEEGLRGTTGLTVVERPAEEVYVGSSIQFLLSGWSAGSIDEVMRRCAARCRSWMHSWRRVTQARQQDGFVKTCSSMGACAGRMTPSCTPVGSRRARSPC